MEWSAIAAIAEMMGAIAVVLTLVYLGRQIKESAVAARRAGAHDVMMTTNPLLMALACDGEVASIWARGLADFHALDPIEQVRFSSLALTLTYSWDEAQHGFDEGQLDAWSLQRYVGSMEELARLPGFKAWYEVRKAWLSHDNRRHLEEVMADGGFQSQMYNPDPAPVGR